MKKYTPLYSVLVVVIVAFGMQLSTFGIAHAATNTDLSISAARDFASQALGVQVCNTGTTPIKQFVLDIDSTNATYSLPFLSPLTAQPSTPGSVDPDTNTWTGLMNASDCMTVVYAGTETGAVGDTVSTTVSIVSSIQNDDTPNVDPDSSDDSDSPSDYTIALLGDISTEAHLITPGPISASTQVQYGVNVRNIGSGDYIDNGFNIFALTLPPDATFVSASDDNPGDVMSAGSSNCGPAGILGTDIQFPGLGDFAGRQVVVCNISISGGVVPAGDTVYPFTITITAGASMAAGTADVVGVFEGNDVGTLQLFRDMSQGNDLVEAIVSHPNNNIFHLTYDPTGLQAVVERCPGQGETTTDGTGCFTLTFNKLIYGELTSDVIDLGGNGEVDSLIRTGDYTWEVRIKNIPLNSTVEFQLHLNEITDYSAQQNTTKVLGINTIRYAAAGSTSGSTSAGGTLAETGFHAEVLTTSVALLIAGLLMVAYASRRKVIV